MYLAHDLLLERQVAIKFVSNQKTDDPTLARRLLKEAQGVAAIEHPNICPVFDAGTDEAGRPFIVMQYLEGQTLSERLGAGPLPIKKAFEMCAQIADALAAAHDVGIVHRDLKPANIALTPAGQPKVLDFGIAKFLPSSQFVSERETQTGLTQPYTFVGTPAYMSPEQIQGGGLDGRSDLFALGAVLFESLTGRAAFQGSQAIEILSEVLHVDPPPPSAVRPGVTAAQDDVCRQLLAKNPADRFQLATEAADALRRVATDGPIDSSVVKKGDQPPTTRAWWNTRVAKLAAAIGVVALFVASWLVYPSRPSIPPPPAEAEGWFQKGAEALREGAFNSAAKALEEGIRIFPDSPTAYARLAEARAELDDWVGAQEALNQLSQRFPNEGVLIEDDCFRVRAMCWLVGRELDKAVQSYQQLVDRRPTDPGAWVDLGRAQESAVQLEDDAELRAGHHARFTICHGLPSSRHRRLVSRAIGGKCRRLRERQTSLCRRLEYRRKDRGAHQKGGALHSGQGEYAKAQPYLERAVVSAETLKSPFHLVRAQLALSDVVASQGHFSEAEVLAEKATATALESDLDVVAAEGLSDLAITLHYADRPQDALPILDKARRLAEKRGALRTLARIQAEIASVQQDNGDRRGGVDDHPAAPGVLQEEQVPEVGAERAEHCGPREARDRDDIKQAYELSAEALKIAKTIRNDSQIADALTTVATQAATVGSTSRGVGRPHPGRNIHRRQNDMAALPYNLTSRAEVLIQLGHLDEASKALDEVEDGISKGLEAYVARKSRVSAASNPGRCRFATICRGRSHRVERHLRSRRWGFRGGTDCPSCTTTRGRVRTRKPRSAMLTRLAPQPRG